MQDDSSLDGDASFATILVKLCNPRGLLLQTARCQVPAQSSGGGKARRAGKSRPREAEKGDGVAFWNRQAQAAGADEKQGWHVSPVQPHDQDAGSTWWLASVRFIERAGHSGRFGGP